MYELIIFISIILSTQLVIILIIEEVVRRIRARQWKNYKAPYNVFNNDCKLQC